MSALTTVELNHELVCLNRAVCIYILVNARVSLASISYVNSQSFSVGINRRAFNKVRAFSPFAAYVNGSIFSKFIAAVLNYAAQYIFQILLIVAVQSAVEACRNLMVRSLNLKISCTAALAIAFIEENIAHGHGYTVAGQTAGNLYLAVKVPFAILIIGIGQLACQSTQCIVNSFRIKS